MPTYKKILLATDFSEHARKAAAEAVRLARRYGAQLHALHVDVIAQQNIEGFDTPPLASHVGSFDQVALDAVGRDVGVSYRNTVTAIFRDTSEVGGILRYAAQKGIDLIILGTHGRGAVAEALMGSVAQRVVRESSVSVLVVGPYPFAGMPEGGKPVILAPVDLGAQSAIALAHAGLLATERDAHLVALHAIDRARVGHAAELVPSAAEEQARYELERFAAITGVSPEPELLIGVGHADEVICDIARKRHASLLVLAPSSHGAIDRVLLGSVTQRVVRGAPCPVLIHRPTTTPAQERAAA
jgi:nucleotide-binding universal stress UspA family protein